MIPTGFRHFSLHTINFDFDTTDFYNNILLYLPLGVALSGSSWWITVLCGFLLSTSAELLQVVYVDRIPSPMDVTSNTVGALIGWLLAILWLRLTSHPATKLRVPRPLAVMSMLFALVGTATLVRHQPASDFSNWDPRFHLAVGNELTGDRPWEGSVADFTIYSFAMPPSQISALARSCTPAALLPPGGVLPPMHAARPGQPLLSMKDEQSLFHTLVSRNQLTLLVWMRTGNLEQSGPARIITYSQNDFQRNFTLGQMQNTLTFRLRTPASGGNGTNPALYSGPVLALNRLEFVAATYDGHLSTLYVNGVLVAQADLATRTPHLPARIRPWLPGSLPMHQIEGGAVEMLLSGLFTLGLFAFSGVPEKLLRRILIGLLAGALIGGVTWIFGISAARLGMRILLECMVAGMVIAVSVEERAAQIT